MTDTNTPPAAAAGYSHLGDLRVARVGYGGMRLTGPGIMGPPKDPEEAVRVLRRAVELGVNHIDTSDYYGPYVVNDLIREALHPYPDDLVIVTKVGAKRTPDGGWPTALSPADLRAGVEGNLSRLGLQRMDVVNLRIGDDVRGVDGVFETAVTAMAQLRSEGLVRHVGLSNVTADQLAAAQQVVPVVCVQNYFNLAVRGDAELLRRCTEQGIAFVPFFPLGGFSPIAFEKLTAVADRLRVTPQQLALAWLLAQGDNVLVIPGTSTVAHLEENIAVGGIRLTEDDLAEINAAAAD